MSVYYVMFYLFTLPKRSVGPIQQCTTISIISDDLVENAETFHLLLSTMDEGVILGPARAYVTITDNDGQLLIYYLGYTIFTSSTFILQKLTNAVFTSLDAIITHSHLLSV